MVMKNGFEAARSADLVSRVSGCVDRPLVHMLPWSLLCLFWASPGYEVALSKADDTLRPVDGPSQEFPGDHYPNFCGARAVSLSLWPRLAVVGVSSLTRMHPRLQGLGSCEPDR